MASLKSILDFYVFSNIHISICAAFFCLFNIEVLQIEEPHLMLVLFISFSTLTAYNFHRIRGIKTSSAINPRIAWMKKNYGFSLALTALSLLIAILIYFHLHNYNLILLIPLTLICLWYAVGMLKQGKFDKPLREIPFLKIFLIAFVWVGACLMLPAVSAFGFDVLSEPYIQLLAISYGLLIFSLTLPFDIRDLKDDKHIDILTIPGSIGISRTKILSISGIVLSSLLFLVLYVDEFVDMAPTVAFISSCGITIILVVYTSTKNSEYYFSFLLESLLMLPFLIFHLLKVFL